MIADIKPNKFPVYNKGGLELQSFIANMITELSSYNTAYATLANVKLLLKSHKYIDAADCDRLCKKLDVVLPDDVETAASASKRASKKKLSRKVSSTVTSNGTHGLSTSNVLTADAHSYVTNASNMSVNMQQPDQTDDEGSMIEDYLEDTEDTAITTESERPSNFTLQLFKAKGDGQYYDINVSIFNQTNIKLIS